MGIGRCSFPLVVFVVAGAWIGAAAPLAHAAASLTPLGDLPGGTFSSQANAISGDGLVVVGRSASTNGTNEAFRWTSAGGMTGLGDLPDGTFSSIAFGVNNDGSVVVGRGTTTFGDQIAFRWTSPGGMTAL